MNIQGKPAETAAVKAFRDAVPLEHVASIADAEADTPAVDNSAGAIAQEIQLRANKQRISKTLRMSQVHSIYLRDFAAQQSRTQGEKVSESDVLDDALAEFFKRRKFPAR